jgi:hypothetical protein
MQKIIIDQVVVPSLEVLAKVVSSPSIEVVSRMDSFQLWLSIGSPYK